MEFIARSSSRSLQDLEGEDWGDPETAPTHLVRRCLAARRQPIGDLPLDDVRCLIGQGIGLPYLLPRALDAVEADPLIDSGVGYPGSLLCTVLRTKMEFWREWPELMRRIVDLLRGLNEPPKPVDEAVREFRLRMEQDGE